MRPPISAAERVLAAQARSPDSGRQGRLSNIVCQLAGPVCTIDLPSRVSSCDTRTTKHRSFGFQK